MNHVAMLGSVLETIERLGDTQNQINRMVDAMFAQCDEFEENYDQELRQ